jgi:hypothetical protein
MSLDDVPCEIFHSVLEYVTAPDSAALRLVNRRAKVHLVLVNDNEAGFCGQFSSIRTINYDSFA